MRQRQRERSKEGDRREDICRGNQSIDPRRQREGEIQNGEEAEGKRERERQKRGERKGKRQKKIYWGRQRGGEQ